MGQCSRELRDESYDRCRLHDSRLMCPWGVADARDSAKVADQVRFLARTPLEFLIDDFRFSVIEQSKIENAPTPMSNGLAAACKAALSEFDSHRHLFSWRMLPASAADASCVGHE